MKGDISRIVPHLKEGAGVVTTRGHVHWVVTEYGSVNLYGRSLRARAELLISIAHPDFRAGLRKAVREVRHYAIQLRELAFRVERDRTRDPQPLKKVGFRQT